MPRKTLILHIGRQKTGTTAIQQVLDSQRDWLARQDAWYPDAGRDGKNAHHALATALDKRNADDATFEAQCRAFRQEAESRPEETIILSSEALQNVRELSRVRRLSQGFRVQVICYLRESLAWKQSVWAHRVHAQPYFGNFREFALSHPLHYGRFVQKWKAVADDLVLRLFDREHLHDGDVVADFFHVIQRRPSADERRDFGETRTNPSIAGNLLYFKLLVNFASAGSALPGSVFNRIGELAAGEPRWQGRFFVSAHDALAVRRFDSTSNDFLRSHFGFCPEHDSTRGRVIPELDTLAADFGILLEVPALQGALDPIGLTLASEGTTDIDRLRRTA